MKRDKTQCDYDIYPIRPFLHWRECRMCGKEFRREKGWKMIGPPIYNGLPSYSYLCAECAPTLGDAIRLANTRPWMGKMPNMPGSYIRL